ncbi:MAG: dihydrolipoyl dehydrogenase [Gammaproteobacteria bacterium]
MAHNRYDVVVIGAGPAGYVAAIRCAQLGLNTACVDQWREPEGRASLGGTCLNVGCIPSKALLDSSHYFHLLTHQAQEHGIIANDVRIDVAAMQKRKQKIVRGMTGGIDSLFKKNRVKRFTGRGVLSGDRQVTVSPMSDGDDDLQLEADSVIIATGSVPATLAAAAIDQQQVVDSSGALSFEQVPARLGVIGAGVIGLELGSVWNRLGSRVVVLEALDTFLPAVDREIADEAFKLLKRQGLDLRMGAKVTAAQVADSVSVGFKVGDANDTLEVDKLIVAIGRKPNTEGLNGQAAGLKLDARGYIEVDGNCRTNLENVYAVGDVVRGPMLAHKGSEEGVAVAERIAGQAGHVNYATIPWVIYTWPEIAWVGKSEQQLTQEGIEYRTGAFPFIANGRARGVGETGGKVKVLADANTDRILGAHILGPQASELIAEVVTAMEFGASAEDLARTVHAHPTLSEAVHEAALAVDDRAIHF